MKEVKEQPVEEKYEINRRITFHPSIQAPANILSKIFFIWTQKLMSKGAQKPLEMNDLFDLKPDEEPEYAYQEFCQGYEAHGSNSKERALSGFWRLLGGTWIIAGIFAIIANVLQFAGPLMIKQILQFVTGKSGEPDYMGYVWASVLVGSYLLRSLFMQHAFHQINLAAVKCMNSSTSKIYFKVLRLSSASRKYLETGSIMNYINVDTQAFQFFIQMSTFLFSAPVMIVIAIGLTVVEVSWVGMCAPVIFLIGLYFQQKFMKKAFALRKDQLLWTDKRSKCVNEYFSGIRIVKYYGWEQIVSDKIESIRKEELKINFKGLMLRSYVEVLMNMLPIIASVIVFSVYVQVHGAESLETATVYTTISLFNLMSNPMRMLVMTVVQYANAKASLARVNHFFAYPEAKSDGINVDDQNMQPGELKIDDAVFRWETKEAEKHNIEGKKLANQSKKDDKKGGKKDDKKEKQKSPKKQADRKQSVLTSESTLKEPLINNTSASESEEKLAEPAEIVSLRVKQLHIKQGQYIGVVGQVGSGKSTLLNAILNQVDKVEGTVRRRGRVAYIPQVSWLRSTTIRENILFESEYDQERYKDIIKRCELESDMKVLPGGDLTEVGERGVNLSGGQKQRISIARALYADADIYLIDDCLSALDSYVAKKIYTHVIREALALKTVIFVTHAIQYVHDCDTILVMNNGEIFERGTFKELSEREDSLYNTLEVQYKKKVMKEEEAAEAERRQKQDEKLKKQQSSVFEVPEDKEKEKEKIKALVKVEERTKGSVPWSVYFRFFTGAGSALTIATFVFITFGQLARVASDWWLGCWSSDTFHLPATTYIEVYAGASVLVGLLIFFKGYLFANFMIQTAQAIQRKLITVLLHTPLSWFDVTPTGRIISRTTKDQDDLDSNLAFNFQFTVQNLLVAFTSMLVIGIATPFYFIIAGVTLVVYYFLIRYYMLTSVQLKRLEANTRSPLISHIQQTINGMYVIRAFDRSDNFIAKFFQRQKEYIVAYTNQNVCNRWISLVTDIFSIITIAACAYLCVLQRPDPNDPSPHTTNLFGLAITWSLQISAVLSFTLKIMADTENNMNAVIRLLDYIDHNPSEKEFDEPKPPAQWPTDGRFHLENVTYRYRPDLENVIHGISFDVERQSKIGIVGRTGSGKSTLTLGLLRILELSENPNGSYGQIVLDNINIGNIGLHCLRHKVTIIPQDPTLFTGTVKSNIDPFNIYSEEEVAQCLRQVEIYDQIRANTEETGELRQKVYCKVDDSGSNFSVGQRQLICLARALIRRPKVLLMDEATASIDERTDSLIQKMIRKEFNNTTVITIAHRLNTIIHYDKILVLDYGRIKEYGKPLDLVSNESSFLGKLIKDTGADFQRKMIYLAQQGPDYNEDEDEAVPQIVPQSFQVQKNEDASAQEPAKPESKPPVEEKAPQSQPQESTEPVNPAEEPQEPPKDDPSDSKPE